MSEPKFPKGVGASLEASQVTGLNIPPKDWREETDGRLTAAVPDSPRRLTYDVSGKPRIRLSSTWPICCRKEWTRAHPEPSLDWPDEGHSPDCRRGV